MTNEAVYKMSHWLIREISLACPYLKVRMRLSGKFYNIPSIFTEQIVLYHVLSFYLPFARSWTCLEVSLSPLLAFSTCSSKMLMLPSTNMLSSPSTLSTL